MDACPLIVRAELSIAYGCKRRYRREGHFPFTMNGITYASFGDALRASLTFDIRMTPRSIFAFQLQSSPAVAKIYELRDFLIEPELPETSGDALPYFRKGYMFSDTTLLQEINAILIAKCQDFEQIQRSMQDRMSHRGQAVVKSEVVKITMHRGIQTEKTTNDSTTDPMLDFEVLDAQIEMLSAKCAMHEARASELDARCAELTTLLAAQTAMSASAASQPVPHVTDHVMNDTHPVEITDPVTTARPTWARPCKPIWQKKQKIIYENVEPFQYYSRNCFDQAGVFIE